MGGRYPAGYCRLCPIGFAANGIELIFPYLLALTIVISSGFTFGMLSGVGNFAGSYCGNACLDSLICATQHGLKMLSSCSVIVSDIAVFVLKRDVKLQPTILKC